MKSIYERFENEEFSRLEKRKKELKLSWHDFIMTLAEEKREQE